jgi:hypothetical protein
MNQASVIEYQPARRAEADADSIVATFSELARELRLPELDWNVLHEDGLAVVEGRPRASGDSTTCRRWARFLGMSPIHARADGSGEWWLGVNGPWTLEIFAEAR